MMCSGAPGCVCSACDPSGWEKDDLKGEMPADVIRKPKEWDEPCTIRGLSAAGSTPLQG